MRDDLQRILVIDDEPMVRDLLCMYLESAGFKAVPAGDAYEANQLLQQGRFALITLDFHMKGVNGTDLHRFLVQAYEHRQRDADSMFPPILLITGCPDDPAVQELAQEKTIAGVMPKPFSRAQLLDSVRCVLSGPMDRRKRCAAKESYFTHAQVGEA